MRLSGLVRKVEAPLDAVEPVMDAIEPTADFGTELGAVALQMRQMPLDRGKADALLALFRPHLRHVGTNGARRSSANISAPLRTGSSDPPAAAAGRIG